MKKHFKDSGDECVFHKTFRVEKVGMVRFIWGKISNAAMLVWIWFMAFLILISDEKQKK